MNYKKASVAIFEIAFIVLATVAFSYIIAQDQSAYYNVNKESKVISLAREAFISYFGSNLVSAEGEGFYTCAVDKKGSLCQEYPAQTCDSECSSTCFPGKRENFADCALGTCINTESGTCAPNSPKSSCVANGGVWNAGTPSDIPECKPGCCVLGDQTSFVSSKTCNLLSAQRGLDAIFKTEVATEVDCALLASPNQEGACVIADTNSPGENTCKFGTKSACQLLNGAFYASTLCSAAELNTDCQRQASTGCVEGKNEVYWFDSCGNRENIFDANKVKSWNNGKILSKAESCALGTAGNPLLKQSTCGNCNYIGGSVCGLKTATQKASFGDYVCRDLSCIDEQGNKRKQGEKWCAFNSKIGTEGNGNDQRSVDVPGSRHFLESCVNGEITIDPCQDFRNEVCYESRDEETGFSSAKCRVNEWQTCIDANTDEDKLAKCEENPDCVLKTVDIDSQFKFNRCVPRYPPGFDSSENSQDAEIICRLGTQTCVYQTTKKLFGGKKKVNANCVTSVFTEAMNNLCMSLGDCGAKVNIEGDYSDQGYDVEGAPDLDENPAYIQGLSKLDQPKPGQFVVEQNGANSATAYDNEKLLMGGAVAGLGGIALAYLAAQGGVAISAGFLGGQQYAIATKIGLGPGGYTLAGAAAGVAVSSILLKYTGVGAGLTPTETAAYLALGAVAGAQVAAALGLGLALGPVGWIGLAAWGVFTLYSVLSGVGKTKRTDIKFSCLPWQAPRGGEKCGECGKDGLPCSKYACQSLGQTCEFINEGTGKEACANISPNDVNAPVISPDETFLQQGFSYQVAASGLGYTVKGPGADGCLPAYTKAGFGIKLDEPAQCKYETVLTDKYDDNSPNFDLSESNDYTLSHGLIYRMPSLGLLASDPDSTVNPNITNNFDLFVRCIDKSGNPNVQAYDISFCISPQIDTQVATITQFSPATDSSVALDTTEKEVTFLTDSPAECKWSTTDKDYDLMENEATCNYEVGEGTILGWPCSVKLPITAETNAYYFRCKDQPWLTGSETDGRARNVNTQSTPYTLKKTLTPLSITSVSPNGETIKSANTPIVVNLKVTTEGGAPGVARYCDFAMRPEGPFTRLFGSVGTDEHTQNGLQFFLAKKYELPIKCYDDAGNTATGLASFDVFIDNIGPLISRVFYQSGSGLNVITNEKAVCAVSKDSCAFDVSADTTVAGITLMSGDDLVHSAALDKGTTAFVKCQDTYGNEGSCLALRKGVL